MNSTDKQAPPVALVTGGARRIGAAVVKLLHSRGYKVVIHTRHSLQTAHDLAATLNNQRPNSAFVLQRELREPNAAQEIIASIRDWAGRLDVLVNNASVFIRSDSTHFSEPDWQDQFDINVKVPFLLSLAAYPLLQKPQGAIINITDIHAEKPLKGYAVYCQTKAALELQTKALALEFAPEIRVNAIAPGATVWPEQVNALNESEQERIINKTLLKKQGDPEYIAQAVLALVENPYITGQIIKVDGGRSIRD